MKTFKDEEVINGTFGEIWMDNDYLAAAKSFEAKIEIEYEDIERVRKLAKGKKMVSIEGSGELTMHKVDSMVAKKVSDKLKEGKAPVVKFISKLADPDSLGAERVVVKDAKLEELTLADWELGEIGEVTTPFNFSDWDWLDIID